MALTDAEKERAVFHLGFPVVNVQGTISLGLPAGDLPMFSARTSLNNIRADGEVIVRETICQCDLIHAEMISARKTNLAAAAVDNTLLRGREHLEDLESEYDRWTNKLADSLGVIKNPFSLEHQRIGGGPGIVVEPF